MLACGVTLVLVPATLEFSHSFVWMSGLTRKLLEDNMSSLCGVSKMNSGDIIEDRKLDGVCMDV